MITLALDSSGNTGSVALLEGDRVLYETLWQATTGHTVKLSSEVQQAILQTKISLAQVGLFVVTLGPGSFTGIRVALSFVKGLALLQNKPVVGVSTLLTLAKSVSEEGFICPLLDARRDEVFSAVYQRAHSDYLICLEEQTDSPQSFCDRFGQKKIDLTQPIFFLGSGIRRYPEIAKNLSYKKTFILDSSHDSVQARLVGEIGKKIFEKGEFSKSGEILIPQYLRASEAEIRLKKVEA